MGRRQAFLNDAVKKLKSSGVQEALAYCGDVRSEADALGAVEFTIKSFGRLDTLVNCVSSKRFRRSILKILGIGCREFPRFGGRPFGERVSHGDGNRRYGCVYYV